MKLIIHSQTSTAEPNELINKSMEWVNDISHFTGHVIT